MFISRKITLCLFVVCLFLFSNNSFSQSRRSLRFFNQAIAEFRSGNENEAEKLALKAIEVDSLHVNAYMLLADIFNKKDDPLKEIWALENVVSYSSGEHQLAYKLLAEKYIETGQFTQALIKIREYSSFGVEKDSIWIKSNELLCSKAIHIIENKHDVEIEKLGNTINTYANEYWPFISADDSTLYFTRLITQERPFVFERLFFSNLTPDGWSDAEKLRIGDSDEVNEGTFSITANEMLIFFTACGKAGGKGSCDIYYIQKMNEKWGAPVNASAINTRGWDAQPSVSPHGDRIFWSSNREGGFGAKDIWTAGIVIGENGQLEFGNPKNLGNGVNTAQNDFSPFIHADEKTLYFASDGHMGLGKSDLFLSRFDGGEWSKAINMGYPINSLGNDDGLVVSPTAHIAVFSSDRNGTESQSKDLFKIELPQELHPNETGYVKGFVYDSHTLEKINAKIELSNLKTNDKRMLDCDRENGFIAILANTFSYAFNITKPGYLFYSEHFDNESVSGFHNARVIDIYLDPIKKDAQVVLYNVFFEHDSYSLDAKSENELMQIVGFLNLNPGVKIEITGHTDNTGDKAYNLELSKNRARQIRNFLIDHVDESRISYSGYGASQPIANNSTEEGRRKNRRSEMRIISAD
jgi:outer membrane protein OmpA-like peptidoglycan-associated protein